MERDVDFLLNKYYNKYGQEKFVKGERWSNEHMSEHISEQRLQQKMVMAQELGFRLSSEEKYQVKYIIRLLDNNFKKFDHTLSMEQVLCMIICFIRMEKDKYNRGKYYKKMKELDISPIMFNTFLINLLKEYRS